MAVAGGIPVLMYHSIGPDRGPTALPEDTFRAQIETLTACGYRSVPCGAIAAWLRGETPAAWPEHPVLVTFDDALADFASRAHPVLERSGVGALVFVPTAHVGSLERWHGAHDPPRALLDWPTIRRLAAQGVEFGGHGAHHVDLTTLPAAERRAEIEASATALADALGVRPQAFAAPYGRVDAATRADILRHYEIAFGTRFATARRDSPAGDVPRIEMHYFRDVARWRAFLQGSVTYFHARRLLRAVRQAGHRLPIPTR